MAVIIGTIRWVIEHLRIVQRMAFRSSSGPAAGWVVIERVLPADAPTAAIATPGKPYGICIVLVLAAILVVALLVVTAWLLVVFIVPDAMVESL